MNSNCKYFFPLFYFLFFVISMQSQNNKRDSLKSELLSHTEKDTIRVNLLNNLAFYYCKNDLDKTLAYLEESKLIAETNDFKKGLARGIYIRGIAEMSQSNYKQAIAYFNKARLLYEKIGFKIGVSECYAKMGFASYYKSDYNNSIEYYKNSIRISEKIGATKSTAISLKYIGHSYIDQGDYEKAILYYNRALDLNLRHDYKLEISNCFNNIGNVYEEQANYPLALEFYNKSYDLSEKIKDTVGISKALNNIGIIYKSNQNYDKAIENYKKALKIQRKIGNKRNIAKVLVNLGIVSTRKKDYQIALHFFEDALKLSKEINDLDHISTCLNNIGDVYLLHNNNLSYQYYEEAIKINIEIEDQPGLCHSYIGIATAYFNQKKYDEALTNILKSKKLSNKLGLISYQIDVYELLSEIYKSKGQYKKAFSSHQQFKILNDSLFNKENIEKITQLEYEYKYKKALDSASIRELRLTKTVKSTSQNLEKSQRNLLLGVILFLIITLVLAAIIFFLKLRNEKSKTNNIIVEQKLLRSQMTPHFIFNSLSVLQGMILNKEEKKSINYLSKFSKLLRIILENSRDKIVFLSQELSAIENYLSLQNLENESYKYTVLVDDNIDMPLFKVPPMLIQPFVENAIEHAFENQKGTKTIDVHIKYSNKELICTIVDNGTGIDSKKENKNPHKKSLSTTITSERLKVLSKDFKMKGSVTIEDRQKYNEQGTIVTLVIPYKIEATQ